MCRGVVVLEREACVMPVLLAVTAEPAALDVLQKVDAFYTTSWQHLLAVAAAIGIVIPLLTQLYQRRAARLDEEKLRADIASQFKELASSLKEEFGKESERLRKEIAETGQAAETKAADVASALHAEQGKSLADARATLERALQGTRGGLYLVQGNMLREQGNAGNALLSYLKSAECSALAKEERTLGRVLKAIQFAIEKLEADAVVQDHKKSWRDARAEIDRLNESGAYTDAMRELDERLGEPGCMKPDTTRS